MPTAIQISQEVQAITELYKAIEDSNKVTKVSPDSVLNALFFCIAKTGQKINKDINISRMRLFPDSAFGIELDGIAERNGLPARFAATESSTYLFIHADSGTQYLKNTHFFISNDGLQFQLEDDFIMPAIGYVYKKVRSVEVGENQNVEPFKITKVNTEPVGHVAVYNEYICQGGSDNESDKDFRDRLKIGVNILATDTLSMYEQIYRKINNRVLKAYKGGFDDVTGKYKIYLSTINGVDLTSGVGGEIEQIENESYKYLSIIDQDTGIIIENIGYTPIDIEMRIDINIDEYDMIRIDIQRNMQKKYDWRYWDFDNTINWLELFLIAKKSKYVNNILEKYFIVKVEIDSIVVEYDFSTDSNIVIPEFTLPRFRSFRMYDLDGVIISDTQGVLNPAYFPNELDRIYQETVINSI